MSRTSKEGMMEVTKVKYRAEKVDAEGRVQNGQHFHDVALKGCPDVPTDKFRKAMAAVQDDVLKMIGIEGKSFAKSLALTGVTMDKDKHGRRGFVFTCAITTAFGTLNTALPRVVERKDSEGGAGVLSDIALKHVEALLGEAQAYFEQDRTQTELGLEDQGGEAEAAGSE